MNIKLRTHTSDPSLEFVNVTCNGRRDESGDCWVVVAADGFTGRVRFYFERGELAAFVYQLAEMNQTLAGAAVFQPMVESSSIRLEMESRGHVRVSGDLMSSNYESQLKFAFTTDQTVLGPLVADLQEVLNER